MQSLNKGDIVFAKFPFEEDKTIFKPRPCFVISVDTVNNRFLAAKITTTEIKRSWAIHIKSEKDDMSTGSMRIESWINLNRIKWIPFSDFTFKIGTASSDILNNVIQKLKSEEI